MNKTIKIITVFFAVLLVAFMAIAFLNGKKDRQANEAAYYEYEKRTAGYRAEQEALREELSTLYGEIVYCGEDTKLMVGFIATSPDDIAYIRERSERYRLTPVLLFDCTVGAAEMSALIEAADANWEIMLLAPSLSDEMGTVLASVRERLEGVGRDVSRVVFSHIKSITEAQIDMLQRAGFDGYTVYHDIPVSGQSEKGLVHLDFSRVTSNAGSLEERLSSCYANRASMVCVFDMESIRSGNVSEETVTAFMEVIVAYSEKENGSFVTTDEAVDALSKINLKKAEIQASRAERIAVINARMREIDRILSQIYNECVAEQSR